MSGLGEERYSVSPRLFTQRKMREKAEDLTGDKKIWQSSKSDLTPRGQMASAIWYSCVRLSTCASVCDYCNSSTGDDIYRQHSTFWALINTALHSAPSLSLSYPLPPPQPPPPSRWLFIHLSSFLSPDCLFALFCCLLPPIHTCAHLPSRTLTPLLFLLLLLVLLHHQPPLRASVSFPFPHTSSHLFSTGHCYSYKVDRLVKTK